MSIIDPTSAISWQEAATIGGCNENFLMGLVSALASGAPMPATTAAAMTDTTKLYVYLGSESGYVKGDLYSHTVDGWVDSGAAYLPYVLGNASITAPAMGFRYRRGSVIAGTLTIDLVGRTISLPAGSNIADSNGALNPIPTALSVSYTAPTGAIFVKYNTFSGALGTDTGNFSDPNDIVLCAIYSNEIWMAEPSSNIVVIGGGTRVLLRGDIIGGSVLIDADALTISIPSGTIVSVADKFYSTVSAYSLTYSSNSRTQYLLYNTKTNAFRVELDHVNAPDRKYDVCIFCLYNRVLYMCGNTAYINLVSSVSVPAQIRPRICRIQDAYENWENGQKYPVVVFDDSTGDGTQTTSGASNTIGADYINTDAYPYKLQQLLRAETGNSTLRMYNAGFAGKTLQWFLSNLDAILTPYSDAKMAFIRCGLNNGNTPDNYANVQGFLEKIIQRLYYKGIQPVILTTQATDIPYSNTSDPVVRYQWQVSARENAMRKAIAAKYGLEIIDITSATENYLLNSQVNVQTVIPDQVHFGDIGHTFEAGWYFSQICPRVIDVSAALKIAASTQRIKSAISYTKIVHYGTPQQGFKECWRATDNAADTNIVDAWVFCNKQTILSSTCESPTTVYVSVDGTSTTLTQNTQTVATLDIGLHHLLVQTGTAAAINFVGLSLQPQG